MCKAFCWALVQTGKCDALPLKANQLQMSGNIKDGPVWFLKGAARVTTAIAAVVALDKLNLEVGKGFSIVGGDC